jgi:hypothetical protein
MEAKKKYFKKQFLIQKFVLKSTQIKHKNIKRTRKNTKWQKFSLNDKKRKIKTIWVSLICWWDFEICSLYTWKLNKNFFLFSHSRKMFIGGLSWQTSPGMWYRFLFNLNFMCLYRWRHVIISNEKSRIFNPFNNI